MVERVVDDLYGILLGLIPEGWDRIAFHAEIGEKHYYMFYFVRWNGRYYKCYELEPVCGVTTEEIEDAFRNIYELCRDKTGAGFNSFDLTISGDGHFNIDYNYDEYDGGRWREKYLV